VDRSWSRVWSRNAKACRSSADQRQVASSPVDLGPAARGR
jgi:hypothetical protein